MLHCGLDKHTVPSSMLILSVNVKRSEKSCPYLFHSFCPSILPDTPRDTRLYLPHSPHYLHSDNVSHRYRRMYHWCTLKTRWSAHCVTHSSWYSNERVVFNICINKYTSVWHKQIFWTVFTFLRISMNVCIYLKSNESCISMYRYNVVW